MMKEKTHYREQQFRPQAAKTLQQALKSFIHREFPRLGGPWVIERFVKKLLEVVDKYRFYHGKMKPGQVQWPAVMIEDPPAYRKPISWTSQTPVIVTIVNQEDIDELRHDADRQQLRNRAIVRAAHDAYAQGGVLTCTDLGLLFQLSHNRVAQIIREYEAETGEVMPRRGTTKGVHRNIHDMGRTVTHKKLICRKAYQEGKMTPQIARETFHSPEAVDSYVLDFSRVYFATVQRGMSVEETSFAIQKPLYLVEEYVKLIEEFGLDDQVVYDRAGVQMRINNEQIEPTTPEEIWQNERREKEPIAG